MAMHVGGAFDALVKAAEPLVAEVGAAVATSWPKSPHYADRERERKLQTLAWSVQAVVHALGLEPDIAAEGLAGSIGQQLALCIEYGGAEPTQALMATASQIGSAMRAVREQMQAQGNA